LAQALLAALQIAAQTEIIVFSAQLQAVAVVAVDVVHFHLERLNLVKTAARVELVLMVQLLVQVLQTKVMTAL
jgi:hypothetical protein